VVDEPGLCRLYELREPADAEFRRKGAPDGLPLPSPYLVFLVSGQYDLHQFYKNGALGAQCIRGVLEKNGLDITLFRDVLDFGCGCGRIMRHWHSLGGPKLFGTDYNTSLVDWCRRSLPFAQFQTNAGDSKMDYPDDRFDLIYAISIFTHLVEPSQQFWITELRRVLRPGGILYLTTHGTSKLPILTPEERKRFEAGQLVMRNPELSGTNPCAAFHPEAYIRRTLAGPLRVLDIVPLGAKDARQDALLLQKH
jgi:SAM-dependent methyltransferase